MVDSDCKVDVPEYARVAIDALERHGHEAWLVGGCVRDTLLGRVVNDYDIATSAHWEDVESILLDRSFNVHRTGTAHGTVTASLDGNALEITTYRIDGAYTDGRHPDSVEFVRTIEEDLARRDFTMNALAYHPDRGLLDCWGGLEDIERKVIRVVGAPEARFDEDALRILRGCRFVSQLGFSIEPSTFQAMKSRKRKLLDISAERITHELDGLLLGDNAYDALMETVDVLVAALPEVAACKHFKQCSPYHIYDVWEHTAWVVQRSPATRLSRWAALLHDIGKPAAFFKEGDRGHFYGHARWSAVLAKTVMERLLMSPAFSERVLKLVKMHDVQVAATPQKVARALARLDGDVELFRALIDLKKADALAHSDLGKPRLQLAYNLETVLDELLENDAAFSLGQLAINGHDVMELDIEPGPEVGRLLETALDAVIDGYVPNEREALLSYLRSIAK